jgi:hypothetical protein
MRVLFSDALGEHGHSLLKVWGITGQKPSELADVQDSENPETMRETTKPRQIEGKCGEAM